MSEYRVCTSAEECENSTHTLTLLQKAAPALLEALEIIERIPYSLNDREQCHLHRIARAAIRAASGETK